MFLVYFLMLLNETLMNIIYRKEKFQDDTYVDEPTYNVTEIPNFLTDEECDKIIELAKDNLFDSKIYSSEDDVVNTDSRISKQAWLYDNDPFIKSISDKVKDLTRTHDKYHEELQVVRYEKGGFFKPHYDACDGSKDFCTRMDGDKGPRYLTVLFYLNDVPQGGETVFPYINKSVKPEKRKAVIFQNVNDDGIIIKQAFHGGEPVKEGEKWIANKWIRITPTEKKNETKLI